MNYKQLDDKMKVKIDFLLEKGLSLRACARELGISHSTISRYKNNVYKKREINIQEKYKDFLDYLYKHYDWRCRSIEVCVHHCHRPASGPAQRVPEADLRRHRGPGHRPSCHEGCQEGRKLRCSS